VGCGELLFQNRDFMLQGLSIKHGSQLAVEDESPQQSQRFFAVAFSNVKGRNFSSLGVDQRDTAVAKGYIEP